MDINSPNYIEEQIQTCIKFGTKFIELPDNFIVGISINIKETLYPINGLRHPIINNTSGWYIWKGEYSSDPNFFIPLHFHHLKEWCPEIIKYLGLPPGWRFQIAPNHEDIWEDITLIIS